jgi:DNA-binding CsgD family transcriptional regulator
MLGCFLVGKRVPAGVAPLPPLDDLELHTLTIDGEQLAVLSYPVRVAAPASLTAAERDVVQRIVRGETNAEIARARRTSLRTVANQVAAVFEKLDVSSRRELVAKLHAK